MKFAEIQGINECDLILGTRYWILPKMDESAICSGVFFGYCHKVYVPMLIFNEVYYQNRPYSFQTNIQYFRCWHPFSPTHIFLEFRTLNKEQTYQIQLAARHRFERAQSNRIVVVTHLPIDIASLCSVDQNYRT
jgi:hypothetical protein